MRVATMEPDRAEEEEEEFGNIKESRQPAAAHNTTPGGYATAWLNAARSRTLGPNRTQEVQEGDSITLMVEGKYLDIKAGAIRPKDLLQPVEGAPASPLLTDLGQPISVGGVNQFLLFKALHLLITGIQQKPAPEAYLGYALYDADSNMYDQGRIVLSKKARNRHEELKTRIFVPKDGYIEAYVVNESDEDVWFDQFRILSTGPVIVQETHYDPWGLELTGLGYQYGAIKVNKYLYNGKELIEDNGLQYYDYGARMYDASIGRWSVVDPMSEKFASWSVYHYGYNRPISVIDPNGMENIAVAGAQNDEREGNKLMFVNQALRSMRRWSENESEESRTMVVFKGDYTAKQMSKIGASVEKFGGKLLVVNSAEELINYTNSGDVRNSEVSEARLSDKVTDMDIYSHGVTGSIEFGFGTENAGPYRLDGSNIGGFKSGAFGNDAVVTSYACRTGLGNASINFFMAPFESMNVPSSLAQQMANSTGATVKAYAQRTSYAGTLGNAADRRMPTLYPVPQTTIVDGAAFTPFGANRPVGPGGSPLGVDPRLLIFRPRK